VEASAVIASAEYVTSDVFGAEEVRLRAGSRSIDAEDPSFWTQLLGAISLPLDRSPDLHHQGLGGPSRREVRYDLPGKDDSPEATGCTSHASLPSDGSHGQDAHAATGTATTPEISVELGSSTATGAATARHCYWDPRHVKVSHCQWMFTA